MVCGVWIRRGAAVFDVGINRSAEGTLPGDVEYNAALKPSAWNARVLGCIGSMTSTMLLLNPLDAANFRVASRNFQP